MYTNMEVLELLFPIPSILDFHCEVGGPLRSESQEVIAAAALAGVQGFGVNNMGLPMLRGKRGPALAFAHACCQGSCFGGLAKARQCL